MSRHSPLRPSRPLLLGHRGARALRRLAAPGKSSSIPAENTLAAFDYALANGCDGFEFDVRYTRDLRSVLCHDPTYNRKQLALTDYARLERRPGTNLPCLEEVLKRFAATAYLDIELKVRSNEEAVVAAIHATPPQRGYIVSSFLPEVLLRVHEIDASIPLGYICQQPEESKLWTELPIAAFVPHYSLVSQQLVDQIHARGLQMLAWTINRKRELLRLADWGIDGLISDNPKLLSETFPAQKAAGAR